MKNLFNIIIIYSILLFIFAPANIWSSPVKIQKLDNGPGRYCYFNKSEKLWNYIWLDKDERFVTYIYKSKFSPATSKLDLIEEFKTIESAEIDSKVKN